MKSKSKKSYRKLREFIEKTEWYNSFFYLYSIFELTHFFPMHLFSTPLKISENLPEKKNNFLKV